MFEYRAVVTKVYDGDTITCDVDLGFGVSLRGQTFRLAGIDAPEVKGLSRLRGLESRDYLRELILDKEVILRTRKDSKGKYGRWIATVLTLDGVTVNQKIVEDGHAIVRNY